MSVLVVSQLFGKITITFLILSKNIVVFLDVLTLRKKLSLKNIALSMIEIDKYVLMFMKKLFCNWHSLGNKNKRPVMEIYFKN